MAISDIDIAKFAKKSGIYSPEKSSTYLSGGTFSDIIDIAQTPQYALTGLLSGQGAKAGVKQRMMPSETYEIKGIPGFILDVVTDPLTYIGIGGLTKTGVKATKAAKGAATLGGAAQKGERALLTLDLPFMKGGKALVPKSVSEATMGGLTKAAQPIRRILGDAGTEGLRMLKAAPKGSTISEIEKLSAGQKALKELTTNLSAAERASFSKTFEELRGINKEMQNLRKQGLVTPEDINKFSQKLSVPERYAGLKLSSKEAEDLFTKLEKESNRLQEIYTKHGGAKLEGKGLPGLLTKETKEYLDAAEKFFPGARKFGGSATRFAKHVRFEPVFGDTLVGTSEKLGLRAYDDFAKKTLAKKQTIQKSLKNLLQKEQSTLNKLGKKTFMSADQVLELAKKKGIKTEGLTAKSVQDMMQSGKVPRKYKKIKALFKVGGERAGKVKGAAGEIKSTLKETRKQIQNKKNKLQEIIQRDRRFEEQAAKLGATPDQLYYKGKKLYKRTAATPQELNIAAGRKIFKEDAPLEQMGLKARQTFKQRASDQYVKQVTELGKQIGPKAELPPGMARSTLPELKGYAFPEDLVPIMDSTFKKFSNVESVNDFLKKFDAVQNTWKKTATFWNPAFHTRNAISNQWQMILADGFDPRDAVKAAKMFKNKKALDKAIKTKALKDLTAEEKIWKMFTEDFGLGGTGWVGGDIEQQLSKLNVNPMDKLGGKVGEIVEDSAKLQLFVNRLRQGYKPEAAAMDVRKFLFDYGDLSDLEKNVFKRVFPFYTWTRNNIPLQISMLIQKPAKYSVIDKVKRAYESTQEDKPMDPKYLPEWMQEAYPIFLGKDGKGLQRFFALEGFLPAVDLNKIGRPGELPVDLLSPIIKTPLELAMNYDTFLERQIKEFEGQKGELFRKPVPKIIEKLGRTVRPLTELERIVAPKQEYGRTPTIPSRLRTYLIGKIRTVDEAKARSNYKYRQSLEEQKISSAIKTARKEGKPKEAKRLMELLRKTKRG